MGYKTIIQILLILAIISTICICTMKPQMHKPVMVYSSDLKIVSEDTSVKIEENNIPVMIQNADVRSIEEKSNSISNTKIFNDNNDNIQSVKNTKNISFSNKDSSFTANTKIKTANISPVNNVNIQKNNISANSGKIENVKPTVKEPQIDLNKIVANNKKITSQPNVTPPAKSETPQKSTSPQKVTTTSNAITSPITVTSQATKTPEQKLHSNTNTQQAVQSSSGTKTQTQHIMSAQEEEIAWNKWRSNLNNQIMRDSKLPIVPNGIVFKYKFSVDKFGKVSNVQTWSTTQSYTPYAIQFIAPVIRSYQGHAILNFPTGSNRVTTEVTGAWRISSSEKLSTPSDYNDIEKIKK